LKFSNTKGSALLSPDSRSSSKPLGAQKRRVGVGPVFRPFPATFPDRIEEHLAESCLVSCTMIEMRMRVFVVEYLQTLGPDTFHEYVGTSNASSPAIQPDDSGQQRSWRLIIPLLETGQGTRDIRKPFAMGRSFRAFRRRCLCGGSWLGGTLWSRTDPPSALSPPQTHGFESHLLNVVELTVQAACGPAPPVRYQAALLDPNTAATLTTSEIVAMCDDMISAHGSSLPAGLRT